MFLKAVHEEHYHDDKGDDIDLMITMTMIFMEMTLRMKSAMITMNMLQPVQKHSLICVPYLETVIK